MAFRVANGTVQDGAPVPWHVAQRTDGPTCSCCPVPGRAAGIKADREQNLNILVTGGAGYIGSQTAAVIERSGLRPVVLDNLCTGHRWAVGPRAFVEGDLGDDILVRRALEQNRIDAVVHFAAFAYVGESVTNPRKYFHNNVVSALKLLDAMV